MTKIFNNAASIEVESRDQTKALSVLNLATLSQNPYYYYEGIQALLEHNLESQYDVYVFFPQINCILGTVTKYSEQEFLQAVFPGCMQEMSREADAFLHDMQFTDLRMLSSFPLEKEAGTLLLGIPVRLGVGRSEGLIIYRLRATSLDKALFSSPEEREMQIAYLNKNNGNIMYMAGNTYFDWDSIPLTAPASELADFSVDGSRYFSVEISKQLIKDHTFISVMPFDLISYGLHHFYSVMRMIMSVAFVVLVLLMGALIYLNYKPIHRLASQTEGEENDGEFEAISKTLNRMAGQISEQDMMIMDMLLANMLHGIPIREGEARRLGVMDKHRYFCVFTARKPGINTDERERIVEAAQRQFGIHLYITELFAADLSVFICLMGEDTADSFAAYLQSELNRQPGQEPVLVRQGKTVSRINDICRSYGSCQGMESENEAEEKSRAKALSDEILLYLQTHFTDTELSQSTVADTFGISIYSLSRLFKNQVGIGFSEYITGKRLEFSRQQLLLTNDSVSQIAATSGFLNANYFSRLFKSHFGVSPGEYRKMQN